MAQAAVCVPKRFRRAVSALMCLTALHLVLAVASCEAEPAAMGAAFVSSGR